MKTSDVSRLFDSLTSRAKLRKMERTCRSRGQQPVHFLHIGKTGRTAIKRALGSFTTVGHYVIELHPYHIRLQYIPRGDHVVVFLREESSHGEQLAILPGVSKARLARAKYAARRAISLGTRFAPKYDLIVP